MKVQIIIGSTRPTRIGNSIAEWIKATMPERAGTTYEAVDIASFKLPLFDEPVHPSMSQYQHDHTKVWSDKIKEADAYIFVTPEYNAGYPAALKNAIDYLYHEWTDKPVMIVSYGAGGGAGAAAQLRQVAERLKMRPTALSPAFAVPRSMSGEDGQLKDIATDFAPYESQVIAAAEELFALEVSEDAVLA